MSTSLAEIKEGQNMHNLLWNGLLEHSKVKNYIYKIYIRIVLHQLHGRVHGKRSR